MSLVTEIQKKVFSFRNPQKIKIMSSFHGPYCKDEFWGISIKELRQIAKKYYENIGILEVEKFLFSGVHELKLLAVEFLKFLYRKRKISIEEYIKLTPFLDSWDLVDFSAPYILGEHFLQNSEEDNKKLLKKLLASGNIWSQRVAVVACWPLIKKGRFCEFFFVFDYLCESKEPLHQKALGWMLREVGKVSRMELDTFLEKNLAKLSSLALNYALERHSAKERLYFRSLRKNLLQSK